MKRRAFLSATALPVLSLAFGTVAGAAAAPAEFDFSPEQRGRVRAVKDIEAVQAVADSRYRFVRDGAFTVAVTPSGPPTAAYARDARTVIGADPDYAQLVADALGLSLQLVPIAWADWPLGLTSGKYDAVISNVGVTEQRKKKFDFTTYRLGLHGFYVADASPIRHIGEPADIAGLRVITESGTIQERIVLEWSRRNEAHGLKPVTPLYFDDEASARLALLSGRADAELNPDALLAYEAATQGKIRRVGTVNAGWPLKADVAIATRKGGGLAPALTLATNRLIQGGQYRAALARWRLESQAVEHAETNPPGLPAF